MIVVEPYRLERLIAFLDPWGRARAPATRSCSPSWASARAACSASASAGVQKFGYLPEAHTDLIFAIIGEELGLLGTLAVVAGFAAIAWAGFSIALAAKDPFGQRLAAGVTALVVGQARAQLRRRARHPAADRRAGAAAELRRDEPDRDARGHRHGALGRGPRPGRRREVGVDRASARPFAGTVENGVAGALSPGGIRPPIVSGR